LQSLPDARDRDLAVPKSDSVADETGRLADVLRFLPTADFVVLTVPLTRETVGLVDRAFLASMKPDAVLVNVARGKLIVEDDLFDHLRTHPAFARPSMCGGPIRSRSAVGPSTDPSMNSRTS